MSWKSKAMWAAIGGLVVYFMYDWFYINVGSIGASIFKRPADKG